MESAYANADIRVDEVCPFPLQRQSDVRFRRAPDIRIVRSEKEYELRIGKINSFEAVDNRLQRLVLPFRYNRLDRVRSGFRVCPKRSYWIA